jgi:micrococcal nuclease
MQLMVIALVTLFATVGALLLAAYFTLRRRLVLAGVCLVCFFALLRPGVVYGAEACMPIRYADGDTFSFMRNGALVRVRVAGFDAPERAQPFGQAAEARLQLLTRVGASCDCYKADRHGRSVCTVHTRQGANVATLMLQAGLGCIDERFEAEASAEDREAARAALAQAQAQRVGMWAQREAQCAVDYRRAQRAQ